MSISVSLVDMKKKTPHRDSSITANVQATIESGSTVVAMPE
jgi:hypothetical protein